MNNLTEQDLSILVNSFTVWKQFISVFLDSNIYFQLNNLSVILIKNKKTSRKLF